MNDKMYTMWDLKAEDLHGEWESGVILNNDLKGKLRLHLYKDQDSKANRYKLTIDHEDGKKIEYNGVYKTEHTVENTQKITLEDYREFQLFSLSGYPESLTIEGFNKSNPKKIDILTKTNKP